MKPNLNQAKPSQATKETISQIIYSINKTTRTIAKQIKAKRKVL